ncbi:hypothetical protein N7519_006252 [Penicillium mononematosum]|uniref:uncharacterized protein n=1 Tax=Penicillium mononematosum TaxID=268346 RepID=UPI0025490516|nr:uncharacterized protein N7519_006252 [Penicillium mononematosum]KAJ6184951.1 hypothetical protein N7519_006252 [Penicillium mononematosum]
MKWLCVHGTGSSATIFQDQLAAVTAHLPKHAFHFINGPFTSKPAAGLDLRYPDGPYYTWWQKATVPNIRAACENFHKYLIQHNSPYDGVTERPTEPLPFKAVVFICGGPVFSVLEGLGMTISDEVHDDPEMGKGPMDYFRGNGDTDLHLDPSAPIDPSNVFGLDTIQTPQNLRIEIPTLHVYGRVDPRLPASLQLLYLSESTKRLAYQHEGGHNIPRSSAAAERIARLIDECAQMMVDTQ